MELIIIFIFIIFIIIIIIIFLQDSNWLCWRGKPDSVFVEDMPI